MASSTNTTFGPTNFIDIQGPNVSLPPLAEFANLTSYQPHYGDFVVWTGWWSTWVGLIIGFDKQDTVDIIFANIPVLLFTMDEAQQRRETRKMSISQIRSSPRGKFSILHHEFKTNSNVWFV